MQGLLLIDKQPGSPSFRIVSQLRRLTGVQKIGHAGTLDPFATGVMLLLIGKSYTQKTPALISADKEYRATLCLGVRTDTFDLEGRVIDRSPLVPSLSQVETALAAFQGTLSQIPPMFSAKKVGGKKLYDLARQGVTIPRQPSLVTLSTTLISYDYPRLDIHVACSKGTYIRTLADDIGEMLGCHAHLTALCRTRVGPYTLADCLSQTALQTPSLDLTPYLRQHL
jgi:tRNA pseudouridine55 synthase